MCVYACAHIYHGQVCHSVCNLQELVLPFCHTGSRNWTCNKYLIIWIHCRKAVGWSSEKARQCRGFTSGGNHSSQLSAFTSAVPLPCHLLLESLFFISCAKAMSKWARFAFSHWLIILQTQSAAKTLVAHLGLLKGCGFPSLLLVKTEASSPLSPSSSCIVSRQVTAVKSSSRENISNYN